MDNLFLIRTLTTAINEMMNPDMVVYNRLFRAKEHMDVSDRLAFEVITGSQKLLKNISIYAPAEVTDKTGRKVITLQAPRLAQKRMIHTAELNSMRAYGQQIGTEMMDKRVGRELLDMKGMSDRTMEFWAVNALKGKIYDSDMTTLLVDYNVADAHKPVLAGDDLWTAAASQPVNKIREWKRLIKKDAKAAITGWLAFVGATAMDALLQNSAVLALLKYEKGRRIAEEGDVERLAKVELIEYDGTYVDNNGNDQYFLPEEYFMLIGLCDQLVDTPYAPIVDDEAPGGVGNIGADGNGVMYFSKSWSEKDPSGRWIKAETRPLPVLQRPGAVVYAKVR